MVKLNRRIATDDLVFKYIKNQCKEKFMEINPSFDGRKVSDNQVLRSMIKNYLGLFVLKNDKHNFE